MQNPIRQTLSSVLLASSLALVLQTGCGGDQEPPPRTAADEDDDDGPVKKKKKKLNMSSEIGGLNEDRVSQVFEKCMSGFEQCLNNGAERVEFLGGMVEFFVKIGSNGRIEHAHLEKSTIGDRETELCMLETVRNKKWPKPVGGEHGLARKSFTFDPPNDVRPPTDWDTEPLEKTLGKLSGKIDSCKSGARGSFEATIYVSTNGSVMAVGVTPPNEDGDEAVDCLVSTLKEARFPSPGSWPAKVTFAL
jgi:hypothetical protein